MFHMVTLIHGAIDTFKITLGSMYTAWWGMRAMCMFIFEAGAAWIVHSTLDEVCYGEPRTRLVVSRPSLRERTLGFYAVCTGDGWVLFSLHRKVFISPIHMRWLLPIIKACKNFSSNITNVLQMFLTSVYLLFFSLLCIFFYFYCLYLSCYIVTQILANFIYCPSDI
jgi:hypothetical protein